MLLGIFGGSFDPVHNGHLALARACHEQAKLDEIWFMPTAVQPLKQRGPHATDAQRIEMLEIAIDSVQNEPGRPRPRVNATWRICTLEIDRGGYSYTVDTLRQLHTELPESRLFFMIGADAVRDIPHWKEPSEIFRLATPLVVRRAGMDDPDLAALTELCTAETKPMLVEMSPVDVSSSEIRSCIAVGESLHGLVPPAVADYILQHGIYRRRAP
jgi:nicotinate-nucleotide adenylyltransferase